jgi:hypothetical protein
MEEEALRILDEAGAAKGYTQNRSLLQAVKNVIPVPFTEKVRETLFVRAAWRPDAPLILNGG